MFEQLTSRKIRNFVEIIASDLGSEINIFNTSWDINYFS